MLKIIQIIEFESQYSKDFARLNYEWIEEYFAVEPYDREMLDNPNEFIIGCGRRIIFALSGEEVVGTVALIKTDDDSFELATMAVTEKCRGLKIGNKLMRVCIEYSKKVGKTRLFLLSNTKLTSALNLYKKNGFQEIPLDPQTPYQRTDIQMELLLENIK